MISVNDFKWSLKWKWAILIWCIISVSFLTMTWFFHAHLKQQMIDYEIQRSNTQLFLLKDSLANKLFENSNRLLLELKQENGQFSQFIASNEQFNVDLLIKENDTLLFSSNSIFDHTVFNVYDQWEIIEKEHAIIAEYAWISPQESQPLGRQIAVRYEFMQLKNRLNELMHQFILFGVVFIFFLVFLAVFISNKIYAPIELMLTTMQRLTKTAPSRERMPIFNRQHYELNEFSEGFNELMDIMSRYIVDQKRFVEDASHELKTPVAIVEGHLKLLNRWGKNDKQILDESVEASLLEIGRMKTLVQEMLDLSKAEHVNLKYRDEITEIISVIKSVYQNFQLLYEDFQFDLEIHSIASTIQVPIFLNHFEQVLIILLDNAVKYSTNVKRVILKLHQQNEQILIEVIDFGEGIAETDLNQVFNRFYRIDKARARAKGGNGLGLSIAKELIEGYKGTLTVKSTLTKGSIFRITLPILLNNEEKGS